MGLLGRNEIFLWASVLLFFGPMVISYLFAGFLDPILAPLLANFQQRVSDGTLKLETLSLFINNATVATYLYIGGILVGGVNPLFFVSNGVVI